MTTRLGKHYLKTTSVAAERMAEILKELLNNRKRNRDCRREETSRRDTGKVTI